MIAAVGTFAAAFYTLLLGWAWPSRRPLATSTAILSGIVKSIWLAWCLIVLEQFLHTTIPFFLIVSCWLLTVLFQNLARKGQDVAVGRWPPGLGYPLYFVGFVAAAYLLASGAPLYQPIFSGWDALASWNNWAIQLSQHAYSPYNAAYPVLWPGIWALVYEAQGTAQIWFYAKATMIVVPVIGLLSTALLLRRDSFISASISVGFIAYYFRFGGQTELMSGWMDDPVALLILSSGITLFSAATERQSAEAARLHYQIGALIAGMAAATKQSGVVAILLLLVITVILLKEQTLHWKEAVANLIMALTFPALFLVLFYMSQPNAFGNLQGLEHLSRETAGASSIVLYAAHQLVSVVGRPLLVTLVVAASANLLLLKHVEGRLGMLFLAAAIVGFMFYADCCSYDGRNARWIPCLLFLAALGPFRHFEINFRKTIAVEQEVRIPGRLLAGCATAFVVIVGVSTFRPDWFLMARQQEYQWEIVSPALRNLILHAAIEQNSNVPIVSPFQPIKWLPGLLTRYRKCFFSDLSCVMQSASSPPGALFLMSDANPQFSYAGLSITFPPAKLLGKADGFSLYGPLTEGELREGRQ